MKTNYFTETTNRTRSGDWSIKYVAEVIYGQDESVKYLDNVVRWVIYALIFVFDPLAVLLLVSSTGLIARRVEQEKPRLLRTDMSFKCLKINPKI